MTDFYEIDFLPIGDTTSGDAITMRYRSDGVTRIQIIDGGYKSDGEKIVDHVNNHYDSPAVIDAVIITHPDRDHVGGIMTVLESFEVKEVWMNRPWLYAGELIDRFTRYSNVSNLEKAIKEAYPAIAEIEKLCIEKGIVIKEAFQGSKVCNYSTILAPSKEQFLKLVTDSDKTPLQNTKSFIDFLEEQGRGLAESASKFFSALWGEEYFPAEGTSEENQMSVVQLIELCERKILLTGDAGRETLSEAADYRDSHNLCNHDDLDKIQVPHHGSRRNVCSETLDRWLGPKSSNPIADTQINRTAIVSAAINDEDHPRKAVIRGFMHRGCRVLETKGKTVCVSHNAPRREGWISATPVEYPQEQES